MRFVRQWMPLAICLSGLVILLVRDFDEGGWEAFFLLVGAGSSVWLLNALFRLGVRGDVERDAEAAARAFFDRHGHWPDEAPSGTDDEKAPDGPPVHRGGDPHRVPPHGRHRRR